MQLTRRDSLRLIGALPLAATGAHAATTSWPQWRGPNRDGISSEDGLLKRWPAAGPKEIWKAEGLGSGYGSIALVGDRIYMQGGDGRASSVHCLSAADGKKIWSLVIGKQGSNDRGDGPRSTPTIDGDKLYVLTETGDLACLNVRDGSRVWQKHILAEFGGTTPHWLLAESPLIDGDKLIVTPGGSGAGIVALNKTSGAVIWKASDLSDEAGYASAIVATIAGIRCYTTLNSKAGVGVRASDGKLLWRYTEPANRTANCTTPVVFGNKVFYTSAYGTGCGLVELSAGGGGLEQRQVYFNRDMMNHHGGVVLIKGHIYGFSNAILTCMNFDTGEVVWRDRSVGKGSVTYADGQLYLLGEGHTVGLAEATPAGYTETGRFKIADLGLPSWAHPVICGQRLYIRNQGQLQCFDIKA